MARCSHAVLTSAFNLTLSAIGAGLLAFPEAFTHSGLVSSLLLNLAMALLNALVIYALFKFTAHAFRLHHEQRLREEAGDLPEAGIGGAHTLLPPHLHPHGDLKAHVEATPARRAHHQMAVKAAEEDGDPLPPEEVASHDWAPLRTYEEMIGFYLGRRAFGLAAFCAVTNILGALLGYLVIIGDIGTPVIEHWAGKGHWYSSREFLILSFAATVAFPLSNLRSFKELACASILAIVSVLVVAFGLGLRAIQEIQRVSGLPDHTKLFISGDGPFTTLPIFMFAYSCTLAVVPIYAELPLVARRVTGFLVSVSMGVCFVTYSITGAGGYIVFGGSAKGDILKNYLDKGFGDHLMTVAAALMALHVVLAYPVILFPARRSLRVYFFRPIARLVCRHTPAAAAADGGDSSTASLDSLDSGRAAEDDVHDRVSYTEHTVQTILIVGVTSGVACLVPSVSSVFGLVGGFSSTFLSIVFPFCLLWSRHGFGNTSTDSSVQKSAASESQPLVDPDTQSGATLADRMVGSSGATAWPTSSSPAVRQFLSRLALFMSFLGVCFSMYATYTALRADM